MKGRLSGKSRIGVIAVMLLGVIALVGTGGAFAAPASASAATKVTTQTSTKQHLPDPGFGYFNNTFYIYGTGKGFPAASSSSWDGPYTKFSSGVLSPRPTGLAKCGTFGHAEWAPQVFAVGKTYVMYFSACHAQGAGKKPRSCVSTATAASPAGPFRPTDTWYCAPASAGAGAEAIDPSPYHKLNGQRYMLFKSSLGNASAWKIWAVRMKLSGVRESAGATPKVAYQSGNIRTEAPYAVNHRKKVWLFVARHNFHSCGYSTVVFKAKSLFGPYKRIGVLLDKANTGGLCGPGGASITQKGDTDYIAYHAWRTNPNKLKKGQKDPRTAYVAKVGWHANGNPYIQ